MTEQDRQAKRYAAAVRREGLCTACLFREREAPRCAGFPDRARGICQDDGRLPVFRVDAAQMQRFLD